MAHAQLDLVRFEKLEEERAGEDDDDERKAKTHLLETSTGGQAIYIYNPQYTTRTSQWKKEKRRNLGKLPMGKRVSGSTTSDRDDIEMQRGQSSSSSSSSDWPLRISGHVTRCLQGGTGK